MGKWVMVSAAILVGLFVVAAGVFVLRHDWLVEELMERVHEGNESAWGVVQRQAASESPDWSQVQDSLDGFVEMADALRAAKSSEIRDSADGYISAVKSLGASITRQDGAAFQQATAALKESCTDCHFEGGVGGQLDD